jgi:C-terminal processing protease CtpA/Prc
MTLLHGTKDSEARLTVLREGNTLEVTAKRDFEGRFYAGDGDSIREIESGIWLVDLNRAPMNEIDAALDRLASAKGVIFDLRCFPNNHGVLRHLIDEPIRSARWNIPDIVYPDQERIFGWDTSGRWNIAPKAPRIRGKVVFLISGMPISYGESVLAIVEHYRLGELVGQTTPGTNGNTNLVFLPGGYRFVWTGMKVLKHDGSQHHLIGIRPTVPLERTLKAVLDGRDEYIEKALELISRNVERGTRSNSAGIPSPLNGRVLGMGRNGDAIYFRDSAKPGRQDGRVGDADALPEEAAIPRPQRNKAPAPWESWTTPIF